ncbi:MAG: hypothetical protein ACXV7G_11210 [Halobacteriota archaeon]
MAEIEEIVSNNLNIYKKFIDEFNFGNKYVKCLFLNAYNHFLAAKILAGTGLKCQFYNCLRMGLESEWLGIYLVKHGELSLQWAFGTQDEDTVKKIKQLERPKDLRRKISDISDKRIANEDRDDMYSALSDKSHSKLASCAVSTINPKSADQSVECIPADGLKGKTNISKFLSVVQDVQEFAIAELEDCLDVRLPPDDWKYTRAKLSKISEGGYPNANGDIEPFISSQNRPGSDAINAIALLESIRKGSIG